MISWRRFDPCNSSFLRNQEERLLGQYLIEIFGSPVRFIVSVFHILIQCPHTWNQ
jgi:hypothetical protein